MAQGNLLINGTLDEGFYAYRNESAIQMAIGWAPWWTPQSRQDPQWRNQRPTFEAFTMIDELVQAVSTPWGAHCGGLYQQVPSAVGNRYEFSVDAQAWSSEAETPGSKKQASDVNVQIGVDPTGGLDPNSPIIVWSEPAQPLSRWQTLRLQATSQASVVTLFLKSAPSLPKRLQSIFWRNAYLRAVGRYRRSVSIVGVGDTHISLTPETPSPGNPVSALVSSNRNHVFIDLRVTRPDGAPATAVFQGVSQEEERYRWRYDFTVGDSGLYDIRFVSDRGAILLAQRLVQVAKQVQIVPNGLPRLSYQRVYVLLPPTADEQWLLAAARGSYDRRFTIGFSADDAGVGELGGRHVLAVNPHHWPQVLTTEWFQHYYPGVVFTPLVANKPADLEAWLRAWEPAHLTAPEDN